MNRKFFFVLLAVLLMAVMAVSVSADQLANDRWCNSDQYGCWVTGDEGAQDYIMFWSEAAREYFMGPNSSAAVVAQYPAGRMSLDAASSPARPKTWRELLADMINRFYGVSVKEVYGDYSYEYTLYSDYDSAESTIAAASNYYEGMLGETFYDFSGVDWDNIDYSTIDWESFKREYTEDDIKKDIQRETDVNTCMANGGTNCWGYDY